MMTCVDRRWPAWLGKTFSWNDFKCVYMSRWCLHVCHGADMQFLQFLHEEGNGFVQLSLRKATKNHQSSNAKVRACNRKRRKHQAATSATPQTHTGVERTFSSFDILRCWECDHDWWWNKSSLLYIYIIIYIYMIEVVWWSESPPSPSPILLSPPPSPSASPETNQRDSEPCVRIIMQSAYILSTCAYIFYWPLQCTMTSWWRTMKVTTRMYDLV